MCLLESWASPHDFGSIHPASLEIPACPVLPKSWRCSPWIPASRHFQKVYNLKGILLESCRTLGIGSFASNCEHVSSCWLAMWLSKRPRLAGFINRIQGDMWQEDDPCYLVESGGEVIMYLSKMLALNLLCQPLLIECTPAGQKTPS